MPRFLQKQKAKRRVLDVIDKPRLRGFSYGTLPGHPETGEERFTVRLDGDDTVWAEIRAFSCPGRWFTGIAGAHLLHVSHPLRGDGRGVAIGMRTGVLHEHQPLLRRP